MKRLLFQDFGSALTAALHNARRPSAETCYIPANCLDSNNGASKSSPWLHVSRVFLLMLLVFATGSVALAQMPTSCVAGTNIYYIDNVGGSDSHTQSQAKSKSAPWAHAPSMRSFTGSYSHTAGDCFVFKGGDTWVNSDLGIVITAGGNSAVQDYYGVDLTWSSGGSFTRPVIDLQSIATPANVFNFNAGYITVDNFEIKDMTCDSSHTQNSFSGNANHKIIISNIYEHAYQAPSGGCPGHEIQFSATGGSPPCDGLFDHNIINGADGNAQGGYYTEAIHGNDCNPVTNNLIHDVCSAVNTYSHLVAYNTIYNVGQSPSVSPTCNATGGFHPDCIQDDTDSDIHDNVVYNCTGEWIQVSPQGLAAWPVSHVYNNVEFTQPSFPYAPPPAIQVGTGGDSFAPIGIIYIYNNTIECAANGCILFEQTNLLSVTIQNNHQINSSGTASICINNPPFNNAACTRALANFNYNASSELYQTSEAAAATGYTQTGPYYYSPQSNSSPTVGIGINISATCGLTMLLCADTAYGSSVRAGGVAIAGRTQISRPVVGAWDAGAYAFGSSSSGLPAAPVGLTAIVQ